MSRGIPRIFIFDCCSGNSERDSKYREESYEKGKNTGSGETDWSKKIVLNDISRQDSLIWARDEDNPDFRLVTVHAANEGFQSKMSSVTGSYVIIQFIEKLQDNISKNNQLFLKHILSDIQEDLHNKGKQLMTKTFNNKTEYIKFVARDKVLLKGNNVEDNDEEEEKIEMVSMLEYTINRTHSVVEDENN